jgi:hypothetical protein
MARKNGSIGTVETSHMVKWVILIIGLVLIGYGFTAIPASGEFIKQLFLPTDNVPQDVKNGLECAYLRCAKTCNEVPDSLSFPGDCGTSKICHCRSDFCIPFQDANHKVCDENSMLHPIKVVLGSDFTVPLKFGVFDNVQVPLHGDHNYARCGEGVFADSGKSTLVLDYNDVLDGSCETQSRGWPLADSRLVKTSCTVSEGTYYAWDQIHYPTQTVTSTILCSEFGGFPTNSISPQPNTDATLSINFDIVGSGGGLPSDWYKIRVPTEPMTYDIAIVKFESLDTQACGGQQHPKIDFACQNGDVVKGADACTGQALTCGAFTLKYVGYTWAGNTGAVSFTVRYNA